MQEHLLENFKSEGHSGFYGNVSITLIDKTDGKDPKKDRKLLDKKTQNLCSIWT